MHPSALLLIMVAAAGAAMVQGHPAAHTPAALQFWENTLIGSRMPDAIADLVQRGIDHSPLEEHYSASPSANNVCTIYDAICNLRSMSAGGAAGDLFFHEAQLRPGSTMTASLPAEVESAILPHDVAGKVPFGNLRDVLATFNIPAGSAEAARVRDTLRRCRAPPLPGERKACAASLEGTVRSAVGMLGGAAWAAASALPRAGLPRGPYEVQAVAPLDGDRYVACHKMPFPYAVYHCHMTGMSATRAYKVSLRGGDDPAAAAAVMMLALCHRDTSQWNPAHPAFEVLRTHPGGAPVCHFMPYANLVFVKTTKGDKATKRSAGIHGMPSGEDVL